MIVVNLSKRQELDVDPRENQQINFTSNLDRARNAKSISFLKKQS